MSGKPRQVSMLSSCTRDRQKSRSPRILTWLHSCCRLCLFPVPQPFLFDFVFVSNSQLLLCSGNDLGNRGKQGQAVLQEVLPKSGLVFSEKHKPSEVSFILVSTLGLRFFFSPRVRLDTETFIFSATTRSCVSRRSCL